MKQSKLIIAGFLLAILFITACTSGVKIVENNDLSDETAQTYDDTKEDEVNSDKQSEETNEETDEDLETNQTQEEQINQSEEIENDLEDSDEPAEISECEPIEDDDNDADNYYITKQCFILYKGAEIKLFDVTEDGSACILEINGEYKTLETGERIDLDRDVTVRVVRALPVRTLTADEDLCEIMIY